MSFAAEALLPGLTTVIRGTANSRDDIRRAQEARLRSIVRHASGRVPYYQRLFRRTGLGADDVQTLDDLARVPLSSKADLRALPAGEVVARGVDTNKLITRYTSGSTGEPLTIRRSVWEERLLLALRVRVLLRAGMRWTDRRAYVGLFPSTAAGDQRPTRSLLDRLGLLRQRGIDCRLAVNEMVDQLQQAAPDVLVGFPAALSWLAEQADPSALATIRPRFVVTGAEILTSATRQQITQGFKAPVFDQYGSHEFVFIAWECPKTGLYHVHDHSMIVEVLKDGRPAKEGEVGELVGTALYSYAMPFIRYRLGDLVTRGPAACPCGAPFSTIAKIQGRLIERFPTTDGKSIHPFHIEAHLKQQEWIRRFQIVQESGQSFRVLTVAQGEPRSEAVENFRQLLDRELSGGVVVAIEFVEQIPPNPRSGKFSPYVPMAQEQGR